MGSLNHEMPSVTDDLISICSMRNVHVVDLRYCCEAANRICSLGVASNGGGTLRSNGKCSNENAITDNDLMEYDLNV